LFADIDVHNLMLFEAKLKRNCARKVHGSKRRLCAVCSSHHHVANDWAFAILQRRLDLINCWT